MSKSAADGTNQSRSNLCDLNSPDERMGTAAQYQSIERPNFNDVLSKSSVSKDTDEDAVFDDYRDLEIAMPGQQKGPQQPINLEDYSQDDDEFDDDEASQEELLQDNEPS